MTEPPPDDAEPLARPPTLQRFEKLYHRDQLRAARYAALADSEGFDEICFALEALGMRILGRKSDLGHYEAKLSELACHSVVLKELSVRFPQYFTKFSALYTAVRLARNDAMHTGVYARHITSAAIELCIGLEEALMKQQHVPRTRNQVKDFMVKSPVYVEIWQPVAHARQLMLTHSFSFLPVFHKCWKLLSEVAMAKYLNGDGNGNQLSAAPIEHAAKNGLKLINATVVDLDKNVQELLAEIDESAIPTLWLVEDRPGNLCGVLSPFDLM